MSLYVLSDLRPWTVACQAPLSMGFPRPEYWKVKWLSHVRLFATPWTVAHLVLPGHGILQARILEWVAISFSGGIFLTQGSNTHLLHLQHWLVGSLPPAPLDNIKVSSDQYAVSSAVCKSDCSHYPLQQGRLQTCSSFQLPSPS